jgi:membrane protein DedA with SNARE-associated domain
MPALPIAISAVAGELLRDLGLAGLFVLMFAENVFPPIPSEVVLPLAGYMVAIDELSPVSVLAVSTAGSLAGSVFLYELARHGGRPFIVRYGRLLRVGPDDIDRAEQWFARRGPIVVLAGRCIPGVRSLVSLPAGALRMSRPLYAGLTLIGTLVWNALLIGAGWLLGHEWERVGDVIAPMAKPLLAATLLAIAIGAAIFWRRRAEDDAPRV